MARHVGSMENLTLGKLIAKFWIVDLKNKDKE